MGCLLIHQNKITRSDRIQKIRITHFIVNYVQGKSLVFCSTNLRKIFYLSNRRIQDRDKQRLDRVQQEEEPQWQKKNQEDDKQKREEIIKKKESEDKGKQEIQEKPSKLFQPHQEPVKPAVQTPWSNAGRGKIQKILLYIPHLKFFFGFVFSCNTEKYYVSRLDSSFC